MDSINPYNVKLIEDVVSEFVQGQIMFTAYNVSIEVRKRGGDQRHLILRETIHETVQRVAFPAGYDQSLITMPGAAERPFLFYPLGANMDDYTGVPVKAMIINVIGYTVHDDIDEDEDEQKLLGVGSATEPPPVPQPSNENAITKMWKRLFGK